MSALGDCPEALTHAVYVLRLLYSMSADST